MGPIFKLQIIDLPICLYRTFQDTLPDDMLSAAFTGVINDVGIDPTLIGDICIGEIPQGY